MAAKTKKPTLKRVRKDLDVAQNMRQRRYKSGELIEALSNRLEKEKRRQSGTIWSGAEVGIAHAAREVLDELSRLLQMGMEE